MAAKRKKNSGKTMLGVGVDSELLNRFRIACLANGTTGPKRIREFIEQYVRKHPLRIGS